MNIMTLVVEDSISLIGLLIEKDDLRNKSPTSFHPNIAIWLKDVTQDLSYTNQCGQKIRFSLRILGTQ